MIDYGALGTLIIGLRANDAELDFGTTAARRRRSAASRQWPILALAAQALHRLADRLEPTPLDTEPAC
jgi:hypothetical protein